MSKVQTEGKLRELLLHRAQNIFWELSLGDQPIFRDSITRTRDWIKVAWSEN